MSDPIVIADRVAIPCPECEEVIPVPIVVTIEGEPGEQTLLADPDMTDLWAHVWTHAKGRADVRLVQRTDGGPWVPIGDTA